MAYENEAGRVRRLAGKPELRLKFWDHALREMDKDSISQIDVLSMLKRCSVQQVDLIKFQERIRAVGTDIDGKSIAAVVILDEDSILLEVVTAWSKAVYL